MKHMRKIAPMGFALLVALALTIISGGQAVAATMTPGSGATKIALMTNELNQGGNTSISVSARLTENDRPLGNEPVEFYIAANFFGDRQVNLGTAPTDATGTASLVYTPSWAGAQVIAAHFKGDGLHAGADVTKTITFSGPITQYAPEPVGLTQVRQWITPVIGLGIAIFWAVLLFVGLRTLWGIYSSGKGRLVKPQYIPFKGGSVSENIFQSKDYGKKV